MNRSIAVLVMAALLLVAAPCAMAQDSKHILFFSKSEGFEHHPVAVENGKPSIAETALKNLAASNDALLDSTKDGTKICAENLKKYDLVIFYTQGELTKAGKDGGAPMSPTGQAELLEWIKNGGAFMGYHSASDTFHTPAGAEVTPYLKMVGAEFIGHGGQFEGAIKVIDPTHPTMAAVPNDAKLLEEWYTFNNWNKETMHVLALLEPGDERAKQERYNIPAYPIIWCSKYGNGKVYFNAIGHRDEIWSNRAFLDTVVDAAKWALGETEGSTEPNFDKVVPKESPKTEAAPKK